MLEQAGYKVLAGVCAAIASFAAVYQILAHLRNYNGPVFQRYIVRICFMAPVYATASFFSLLFTKQSIYINTFRDCYESWVIYNFMSLLLAYVGGPGAVEVKMQGYQLMPSWLHCTCCMPPMHVNGFFIRACKQGALQFVWVKPILAVLQVVLYPRGYYTEGYWGINNGYLWITIIYNITYTLALYALLLFYLGAHDLLAPFNPLLKFILVKTVIFMTFWQGILVSMLIGLGVIETAGDGNRLQNFLICLEMFPGAIGMLFAFPWTEYKGEGEGGGKGLGLGNVRHAISVRDVVSDTVHQFAPTYHDYVLYSNTAHGAKGPKKTVRAKTFVHVGSEQGAGLRDNANLLANIELGVHSDSPRQTGDDAPTPPVGYPAAKGRGGQAVPRSTDDDFYNQGPIEEDEFGVATTSATVELGSPKTSKHLQRETEDDEDEEMGLGGPGALEIDDPSQPGHERHATASSRKHHKEDAAAAAKLMREWSDVHLKDKEVDAAGKGKGKSAADKQLADKSPSSGSGSSMTPDPEGKLRVVLPSRKSATHERSKQSAAQRSLHDLQQPQRGSPLTLPKPSASKS